MEFIKMMRKDRSKPPMPTSVFAILEDPPEVPEAGRNRQLLPNDKANSGIVPRRLNR